MLSSIRICLLFLMLLLGILFVSELLVFVAVSLVFHFSPHLLCFVVMVIMVMFHVMHEIYSTVCFGLCVDRYNTCVPCNARACFATWAGVLVCFFLICWLCFLLLSICFFSFYDFVVVMFCRRGGLRGRLHNNNQPTSQPTNPSK